MADQSAEHTGRKPREFTGWHMLAVCVGAFGVIIAVNISLAVNAVRTFPGLNVKNSYVASQEFDTRRDAQLALGWDVSAVVEGGELRLNIRDAGGSPVQPATLQAVLGRSTHVQDDRAVDFTFDGTAHVMPVDLSPGKWVLRLRAVSEDGTEFQQRIELHVRG
ncbi:putative integral membrane protein linked to a cation pump [Tritonibacter multivorans]|uniref:Putative integral membrane protein linked to a cation pump n=1 Tax=Tritonibacter multivorans TaxID=928856 RepID=A0A0P1GND4_9RHOB|nr:FixH family protein [Tritonibacter multivorans]MDA7419773.1 FixH family protein [Tritonibacter multivorans]CUH76147.1 putative integral membrane protein linked to a cation pump [Tritonibacter multivorans]SFC54485.1 Nitrogen fixation protein FixH [Tritonibacter multivorans]